MGITFSDSCCNDTYGKGSGDELFTKVAIDRRKLRLSEDRVQKLVQTFSHHYHLPICGRAELWSLFSTVKLEAVFSNTFVFIEACFCRLWVKFLQKSLTFSPPCGQCSANRICKLIGNYAIWLIFLTLYCLADVEHRKYWYVLL